MFGCLRKYAADVPGSSADNSLAEFPPRLAPRNVGVTARERREAFPQLFDVWQLVLELCEQACERGADMRGQLVVAHTSPPRRHPHEDFLNGSLVLLKLLNSVFRGCHRLPLTWSRSIAYRPRRSSSSGSGS